MEKNDKSNIHKHHRKRLRASVKSDAELATFSDFKVLEYILSAIIPRKDTNPIAHELIDTFGSLYGVFMATSEELFAVKNMTETAARFIPSIFPIARKAELSRTSNKKVVSTTAQAIEELQPRFFARSHELFYVMLLDLNCKIISVELISEGVANFTHVNLNNIIAKASRLNACKVVLAHNHPGGNMEPSAEDIIITDNISMLLTGMGKELLDHLIFAGDNCFSFFKNNLLNRQFSSSDMSKAQDNRYGGGENVIMNRRRVRGYVLEQPDDELCDFAALREYEQEEEYNEIEDKYNNAKEN